jgi:hypothetical protein
MANQARYLRGFGTRKPGGWARPDGTHPQSGGLVSVWPVVEGGGTTLRDFGLAKNAGTLQANASWAPGKFFATSLSFDGSATSYVSVPDSTSYNFGTGPFSIALWMKTTDTSTPYLLSRQNNNNPFKGWGITMRVGGVLQFDCSATAYTNIFGTRAVNDGTWHHIAVTRNGSTGKIYIDGRLDVSGPVDAGNVDDTGILTLSGFSAHGGSVSALLTGNLDVPELWNRVLSPAEIWQMSVGPFDFLAQTAPKRAFFGQAVIVPASATNSPAILGAS